MMATNASQHHLHSHKPEPTTTTTTSATGMPWKHRQSGSVTYHVTSGGDPSNPSPTNLITMNATTNHQESSSLLDFFTWNRSRIIKTAIALLFVFMIAMIAYQSFRIASFHCTTDHRSSFFSDDINGSSLWTLPRSTQVCDPLSGWEDESIQSSSSSSNSNSMESPEYLDTEDRPFPWTDVRLPTFIRPIHYDLIMIPDIEKLINHGNVTINFVVDHTTGFLVLHTKKIDIIQVKVWRKSGSKSIPVQKFHECIKLEQLYISLSEDLTPANQYQVVIEFHRSIDDQLEGFYVSSYFNTKLQRQQRLLTTHFEPTLARTAFPCFDEPAMKASFALQMIHDPEYRAYFNTERISENRIVIDGHPKIISEFESTVPMSTYLVAFIVCDFVMVKLPETIPTTVQIGALVPVGQENNAMFALNATVHILQYYERFFKIPYPLKKLDVVAVPDFGAGAMENWGIIMFRMTTLLYNEKESSSEVKEQVAIVVSHEIAHQWFGNLVTMDWWNDLWLNEGFASFVENLGVDYIHPEWRMLDQFVISTSQHALALDSLLSSHPINTTVVNPADIEGTFDLISYKKGSCLIRMIVSFLGLENLQMGLERYLNRYKFKTARTSQLWDSFAEASISHRINVSAMMDKWIFQQGYPVISAEWNSDKKSIIIRQQPFISSLGPEEFERNAGKHPILSQTWIVPITVVTQQNPAEQLHWLKSDSLIIPMPDGDNQWFKLNHQQSGFYRVNYSLDMWKTLINMLGNSTPNGHRLSPSDRAGLIDDALSLMRIGYLDVTTAMDLTRYLEFAELDYVPWETVLSHLGIIDSIMPQNPMLHRYVLRLIRTVVDTLGWNERPTDGLFENKLRAIVLRAAVFYGHRDSIRTARRLFERWMNDPEGGQVPANIRDTVYHAGVEHGTDREWYHCWNRYMNTTVASEKRLLLGVLGSTRNHYLLSKYLDASLNRTVVRSQDTYFVIQNVARNPIGRDMAWTFIQENWEQILTLLGQGSFALDHIISETTWHFSSVFHLEQVRKFFSNVQTGSGKQAVKQSLEKICSNIYWKRNIEQKFIEWLTGIDSNI